MQRLPIFAVIGAMGLFALNANAALLSDLEGKTYNPDDATTYIQVGDKIFTDFSYAHTGDMPNSGGVNVTPITVDGNFGIKFQGAFEDTAGGGASDALITYTVIVTDPNQAISDAHISANFFIPTTGTGTITETWLPDNASAVIGVFNLNNQLTKLTDSVSFLPNTYQIIHAQKDILLDAGAAPLLDNEVAAGLVQLSSVDQTYSQVPEPASLSLLGIGGAALLLRRKSKKA